MIAKLGVKLETLRPELLRLEPLVDAVYGEFKVPAVVTSTNDGKHKKRSAEAPRGSYHYLDAAFDLRVLHVRDVKQRWELWKRLRDRVQERYPALYDVIPENLENKVDPKLPVAHIHVEPSPKLAKEMFSEPSQA